jgi:hypothetical protein
MTDRDDTLRRLLTLAGSIMEDASAAAILRSGDELAQTSINALAHTVRDLAAIVRVMQLIEQAER